MKKALSLVLVLALVLGCFSFAFAGETNLTDISGNANEEAIQVCTDLGIITGNPDGTYQPEKSVNRAEFAAMITRALAVPDSALTGYTATSFKDTAGYGWAVPYLAFCESKGIMLGDGNGNAMPGRTITVNEAITMVLRAVGYTANSSELVGVWPSNYVTKAQDLKIYDDVVVTGNVDKANAAQIIYNALTVQKVQVASDGTTTFVTSSGAPVSMLTGGLGCAIEAAEIILGTEDSSINLIPYIGAKAEKYTKDGSIVAIGDSKSEFLTGTFDGDTTFKVDGVKYTVADVTTITAAAFDNGVYQGTSETVSAAAANAEQLTLAVEKSGKTIKSVFSVLNWVADNAAVVDAADLEDITEDQSLLGYDFSLDDNEDIDVNSFELIGVDSLDKIAKDNVVYVYAGGDNNEINKVAVGTEIVKDAKVTDQDGSDWTVGGKTYTASNVSFVAVSDLAVGNNVDLYLDAYGEIFKAEKVSSTPDNYGVVKAFAAAGIDDARVKLYTSNDETKTFNIDADANIYGLTNSSTGALIGYSLDKGGVIDAINPTSTAVVATLTSVKILNAGGTDIAVSSDVVVFTTDDAIAKIGDIETGVSLGTVQYIVNGDGYVVAMIVDGAKADKAADDVYAVFNGNTLTYDADQDKNVSKLTGFADGSAFTKNATTNMVGSLGIADGVCLVKYNADGNIKSATPVTTSTGAVTIGALMNNKTTVVNGADATIMYGIADNAVVYELADYGTADAAYKVSSVNALRDGYTITLYETDDDAAGYDVVIFHR